MLCGSVQPYPLIMAFIVGLRFNVGWLLAIFIVPGSRSIVTVMAPLLCIIRCGFRSTLISSLGTRNCSVKPSVYVALAVRTCMRIIV